MICMKSMQEIANDHEALTELNESYTNMINILVEARENNTPIDEGVVKAIIGGLAGITVGPAIMQGVCKVLGINEQGALGNLMTSRLICTALAAYLGAKN